MTTHPNFRFRVALTADFYDESGNPKFEDLGLGVFEGCDGIEDTRFSEHRPEITPDQLAGCAGVVVLTPRVTAESLSNSDELLAIGRFGVGYDSVDVDACTERDVLALITAGAVDRPVAEATIGWMIALTHHMLPKDRMVRTGEWDDRTNYMGHRCYQVNAINALTWDEQGLRLSRRRHSPSADSLLRAWNEAFKLPSICFSKTKPPARKCLTEDFGVYGYGKAPRIGLERREDRACSRSEDDGQ